MGVLDMIAGRLEPTATYAVREWRWIPADAGEFSDGRLGTLTITLQRAERNGRSKPTAVESDSYALEADSEPLNQMGRAFLLCNLTDETQEDVYRTVIAPHPSGDSCTCKAGSVDLGRKRKAAGELECKHRSAVRQIAEAGGFDASR